MKQVQLATVTSIALIAAACGGAMDQGDGADIVIGETAQPLSGTLPYRGVNLCGAEFGIDAWGVGAVPGRFGSDYIYPDPAYASGYRSADYYVGKGMTTFRLPFRWERLQPRRGQALDAAELGRLKTTVNRLLSKGAAVILDPQNFARYGRSVIGSSAVPNWHFSDFWGRVANEFKGSANVLFNLVNEPHDLPTEQWLAAANAAIGSIRATGAMNLILVPGNGWTGAHAWTSNYYGTPNSRAMLDIVDPKDNYAFEVHQYLDRDSGGGGSECTSRTIGSERMEEFTSWLRANGKRGFLGEFGGPATSTCLAAIDDILKHLEENADVYLGWTYWAGGPWWNNYPLSLEPRGSVDARQMASLAKHLDFSTPPPTSTCQPATYEAESMTRSVGGSTRSGWNLWSNGSLSATHFFRAGRTPITVSAFGHPAGGVAPRMIVSVGGAVIGSANVTSTSFASHAFTFDAETAGAREIAVRFDNDAIIGDEDRNLLLDKIVVGCPAKTCMQTERTVEAESMTRTAGGATSGGWNLWSNGFASTNIAFGDGPATLAIVAAGTPVSGVWPHFVVTVGGVRVGSGTASSTSYREYAFTFDASAGTKEVRVTFDNDALTSAEDRNLLLDKLHVRCP